MMELEGGERVMGKVEKGFELVTKVGNLRLYIKGDTLRDHSAHIISNTLVHKSYYKRPTT